MCSFPLFPLCLARIRIVYADVSVAIFCVCLQARLLPLRKQFFDDKGFDPQHPVMVIPWLEGKDNEEKQKLYAADPARFWSRVFADDNPDGYTFMIVDGAHRRHMSMEWYGKQGQTPFVYASVLRPEISYDEMVRVLSICSFTGSC